ncbi:MAG: hypothetical protein K5836_05590 [Clostridiales bacterium]|nr:hypothetical protein [Clostridiales bacterium]
MRIRIQPNLPRSTGNNNLLGVMTAMTGAALGLLVLVAMRRREEEK